jgi:subtilisin family serine protease
MPTLSHNSQDHASLAWQQSQQQRETVFSVLHLMETETFLDLDVGRFDSEYFSANKSTASLEIMPSDMPEVLSLGKFATHPQNITYADTAPKTDVVAHKTSLSEQPLYQLQTFETTQGDNFDADSATRLISHATAPQQADTLAEPTWGWMQYQAPTYEIGLIDFSNLPESSADVRWSKLGGWGEINVSDALRMALDQPLLKESIDANAPMYLKHLGFDKAWANGYTGQGVVVANIDTGLDLNNKALINSLNLHPLSWNFVNNSANIQDDNGHGTITAMEIGAFSDTDPRMMGGAYDAELMVLKAMDASGLATSHNIGAAIHYAVDHGASVINLSLGGHATDMTIQNAMQYAYDHGAVVVAAAGNDGAASVEFPAAYAKVFSNVIAVGATQDVGHAAMASFSNTAGDRVFNFVSAIGSDVNGFDLDGHIQAWSGTSMSAPLVAAEAAILKSANPSLTASQIVQTIMHSANAVDDLALTYGPSMAMSSSFDYVPHEQYY